MEAKNDLQEMENLFLALADKTRLRLLNLMRQEEVCVCFFTAALDESQPKVSRHLSYLRSAGLVAARREGKWIHYRIAPPDNLRAAQILRDTLDWLASQTEMQRDYDRLTAACCSPDAPPTISRAPKPNISAETFMNRESRSATKDKKELETFLL
jgi:ArsR family transcriptional regulator